MQTGLNALLGRFSGAQTANCRLWFLINDSVAFYYLKAWTVSVEVHAGYCQKPKLKKIRSVLKCTLADELVNKSL